LIHLKKPLILLFAGLIFFTATANLETNVSGWSNGGYSSNLSDPDYGTHDWIAQHALDWLTSDEQSVFSSDLKNYLYGTELPDNAQTSDGVGDTGKHHVYFYSDGRLQDDAAAVRAEQEYSKARDAFAAGNSSAVAEHLGMMTHYISDVSVFGHVMGTLTPWGTEQHHSEYEEYVLRRTEAYIDEFNSFLIFDGNLTVTSAYDATVAVAKDTTFGVTGNHSCIWMDQNYNWSNPEFKNRAANSLILATNAVSDVLHTFYSETYAVTPEFPSGNSTVALLGIALVVVLFFKTKKILCSSQS
jgi:hypothetical protein